MSDLARLATALDEVATGRRIAYLGPGVFALAAGGAPASPADLCARLEAEVRVPRRAAGNLWAVAQYIESRKFRAVLDRLVCTAFAVPPGGANPIHQWLARIRPPLIVDGWYDGALPDAFGAGADWGLVQGVSRAGGWHDAYFRSHASDGREVPAPDPGWKSLIYKPHGLARAGRSFLLSDADYVEVLTEIDIQTPIPEEVQHRRAGRPFLFLGCRFDDQLLRTYARQIAKRSGVGHVAVLEGPLSRMEAKFMEELAITRLDLPLAAMVGMGATGAMG